MMGKGGRVVSGKERENNDDDDDVGVQRGIGECRIKWYTRMTMVTGTEMKLSNY